MKRLLFTFLTFISFVAFAQEPPGWESRWSGFQTDSRGISYIAMYDANTAYTIAYDGSGNQDNVSAIGVTTDGGNTWTTYDPVNLPGIVSPGIGMITPTSASTVYIAAYKTPSGLGNGGIWKSTDNGANWAKVSTNAMYSNSNSFCNLVFFTDPNNGFCQGDPVGGEFEMYSTTDGGTTWTPIPGANIDNPLPGEYGYVHGIVSAGGTIWFTTSKGRLFRSTDNGATWTAHNTPLADFGGNNGDSGSVTFKDANEGWILRDNSELYHTTDAGDSWTLMQNSVLTDMSGDIVYVPGADRLIIADADFNHTNYGAAYSDDGGNTWTKFVYYKLDGFNNNDWLNLNNYTVGQNNDPWQLQHTTVAVYDQDHILSSSFSAQVDPNDANTYNAGIYIYVPQLPAGASVEANTVKGLNIYPNPADNFIHIAASNDIKNVVIYDISGKPVKTFNNINITEVNLNIENLTDGFYMIKINDSKGGESTQKLIVR